MHQLVAMYQEMRSLHDAVSRAETKPDGLLDGHAEVTKDIADHESRLRNLERARRSLPMLGVLAGLVGAGTGLIALTH